MYGDFPATIPYIHLDTYKYMVLANPRYGVMDMVLWIWVWYGR